MKVVEGERDVLGVVPGESRHQNHANMNRCGLLRRPGLRCVLGWCSSCQSLAQLTAEEKAKNLESFETVWRTIRDQNPDPKLNGLDWQAIHDQTRPLIEKAQTEEEYRAAVTEMLGKLEASHHAIIPADKMSLRRRIRRRLPANRARARWCVSAICRKCG